MSKVLDEIRDKKAYSFQWPVPYKVGFDAAIALELPVLFAEYVIKNVDTDDSEDGAYYFQGKWQSIEMIYNFWVENIYKP